MPLQAVGQDVVHLGAHTFLWIQSTHFAIEPTADDADLLRSLIASAAYAHDYASELDLTRAAADPAVHGRWWRQAIQPGHFQPCTPEEAEGILQDWANHQDWVDPGFRQPLDAQSRLDQVCTSLRDGQLYRLRTPAAVDEHPWDGVVGRMGFHEIVVIDRHRRRLSLVVASDD